ncbi:hypothetical protein RCZ04_08940 [Capnocytophaga sp. HP1101]
MKKHLITAIATADFPAILTITAQLSDSERYETIDWLKTLDPYSEKDFPRKEKSTWELNYKIDQAFYYALITMVRKESDVAKIMIDKTNYLGEPFQQSPYMLFRSQFVQPVIDYYEQFPPDTYIQKVVDEQYKAFGSISFGFQWYFYRKGWLPFDEERFVRNLLEVNQLHHRSVTADVHFLLQNPEAIEKVLLQLYRIETRVLDLSKWSSDNPNRKRNDLGAGKVTDYWDEVFELLQENGYQIPRSFVGQLFESLLNQWKKPHLDWHCRLLKFFKPTHEEVLANQHTLFAVLGTGVPSVVKTVMDYIATIATDPQFDREGFVSQLPLCFTVQKQPKTLLLGLELLSQCFEAQAPTDINYREQLAVLFTQPDVKVQEQTAALLLKYFNQEGLNEVVSPYWDYLKEEVKGLLFDINLPPHILSYASSLTSSERGSCSDSKATTEAQNYTSVSVPTSWNALLFLLGDCIREKSAATLDVFFNALVELQDQIPADYAQQIATYIKQVSAREWEEVGTMPLLYQFLMAWSEKLPLHKYNEKAEWKEVQALYKKEEYGKAQKLSKLYQLNRAADTAQKAFAHLYRTTERTLEKLQTHNTLPFLATPTHLPFYIDAEILVDRLLQYEAKGEQPDLEDLIVACHRLLFKEVSATAQAKVQTLKGNYGQAIQYFLGGTDELKVTDDLLPLWKVVARLKHPDATLVDKPYYIEYGWEKVKYANGEIDDEFLFKHKGEINAYPRDMEYLLSLTPQYPNEILCRCISNWATMNEVLQVRNMSMPLEVLLRHNLRVQHSGWLYIGACLLFEKRPSRDLAYEYVVQAIARNENLTYLQTFLANALAWDFLPIPRFVEFLDRPNPPLVKQFGKEVVQLYLETVKKQDKLPRNHKKLVEFSR